MFETLEPNRSLLLLGDDHLRELLAGFPVILLLSNRNRHRCPVASPVIFRNGFSRLNFSPSPRFFGYKYRFERLVWGWLACSTLLSSSFLLVILHFLLLSEGGALLSGVKSFMVFWKTFRLIPPKNSSSASNRILQVPSTKINGMDGEGAPVCDLWTDGLICAFEFVRGDSRWVPIGWARILELVQIVDLMPSEESIWWCHVFERNFYVDAWLSNAHWLHPTIKIALRDEDKPISEHVKFLMYNIPTRMKGGLLFELSGQSLDIQNQNENTKQFVLRAWQTKKFLVTVLLVKSYVPDRNVTGITEVQELLLAGGSEAPKSVHEVIAHLACHIFRWNDRIFSKFIFGAADEIESKFVNRTTNEDLNLLGMNLHEEIKTLTIKISRVKRSLHIRDEIVFELLRHLRGTAEKSILEGIKMSTREKLEDLEAIRERIFAIQFILQDAIHASLQDDGMNITHNIGILGVVGLFLSLIIGAFGANLDGIPGTTYNPYAFKIFCGILILIGVVSSVFGIRYYGLKGRRRR